MLSSCASPRVDGASVYGPGARSVTAADVRAAIAADREDHREQLRVYRVEVVNSTEMHIYHVPEGEGLYCIVRRVAGTWKFTDRPVIISG